MLNVTISWDWFHGDESDEEKQAIRDKKLFALVREDGDDNAAVVEAVKAIDAPTEHVRLATFDPMIGDCILVVAWDDRSVNCEPDAEDGWEL